MPRTLAEAARALNARTARPRAKALPHLYLMTDARLPDVVAVATRLPRGAAVVLRHYDDPDRETLGRRLAKVCRARGLMLLVAGDWRLAARLGADGVHLPEGVVRDGRLAPLLGWRRRGGKLLSVAAHGRTAMRRAEAVGADVVLLSPVFPTRSHPGAAVLGATRFAALARCSAVSVVALGGIAAVTIKALAGTGAWGVAAIDGWVVTGSGAARAPEDQGLERRRSHPK